MKKKENHNNKQTNKQTHKKPSTNQTKNKPKINFPSAPEFMQAEFKI